MSSSLLETIYLSTPENYTYTEALQTPYPELRMILQMLDLQEGQAIIDLGAVYGRMCLVIARFFFRSGIYRI